MSYEPMEALRINLAFRTGMLLGTVNLARDMGMELEEIAAITHLPAEALARMSASATAEVK